MLLRVYFLPGNRQSELERHIEPRRAWAVAVEFHSRQVVNRILAALHQGKNSVQPPGPSRNLQRHTRVHSQRLYPANVSEEELLELLVVGEIEENSSANSDPSRDATSLLRPSLWPLFLRGHGLLPLLLGIAAHSSWRHCWRTSHRNIRTNSPSWRGFSLPCQ